MTPTQGSAKERARGPHRRERRIDWAVGIGLFLFTVLLVGVTEESVGFTRDEGYYFKAGETYFGWFEALGRSLSAGEPSRAFDKAVIDKNFSYNREHPVLMKNLFALSWGVLHKQLGLFSRESSAFRFPAWLFAGLSVALVFALARSLLRRRAALIAALLWLSMPRAFWHMHLACFDIPVIAAHTWLVLAYLRGRRSLRGALVCGIAFGLAAAVKHNILIAPAMFVLHWALVEAQAPRRTPEGFKVPAIPVVFFSLAIIGPLVFVAHWPYLWPSVFQRIGSYLGFHFSHEHYPILWFGDLLTAPPFPVSFPFVMSAVTVPVPVLVAFVVGAALAVIVTARFLFQRVTRRPITESTLVPLGDPAREPSASPALLLLLNIAFPYLLIAMPQTPIFGGTKHWMNALPFLCVLAAWAIEEGTARLVRAVGATERAAVVVALLVGLLAVAPGFWGSARVHPYGLGYYNAAVGFARGAANVGFQRTFWGYEARELLPMLNAERKKPTRLHFGDTNHDDWRFYRRDKLLDDDVRWSGSVRGANVAVVQPQGEFKNQWIEVLNHWGVNGPDGVVHIEGVPLATITFKP